MLLQKRARDIPLFAVEIPVRVLEIASLAPLWNTSSSPKQGQGFRGTKLEARLWSIN
jgi:hypothetical protein